MAVGRKAQPVGGKSQAVIADQGMHGARHQLHHFVDRREFPYLKTNTIHELAQTKHVFCCHLRQKKKAIHIYIHLYMLS